MNLRKQLAEHGFESNDDFDYPIACLFEKPIGALRCLNVTGDSSRRKTAFATALASALEYPRVLYLDLSQAMDPPPLLVAPSAADEHAHHPNELPMTPFERVVTEACAFSEAERCILILDQLQVADFRDHIRLYQFISTGAWTVNQSTVNGSSKNLLVVLLADQPLYHSLAHVAFRIWTDASGGRFDHQPRDFGLGLEARELFDRFKALFEHLGNTPTPNEMRRILHDALHRVHTEEQLRQSIFGWMELADRHRLNSPELLPNVRGVVEAIHALVGLDHIQLDQ